MTTEKISGGYILLARKLLNSEIMEKPLLFLKMWIWMLLQASFKDHGDLKRGQFFTSIEKMRNAFSYKIGYRIQRPTSKEIRTAYDFLTKGGMTVIMKVTHGVVITILNYDLYQDFLNYEGHNEGHSEGTRRGTIPRKKENTGNIYNQPALQILAYLNEKTGRKYRDASHIASRLQDGGTIDDCRKIIDTKLRDPFFIENPKHLNPVTLFRKSHWDAYLNETQEVKNSSW